MKAYIHTRGRAAAVTLLTVATAILLSGCMGGGGGMARRGMRGGRQPRPAALSETDAVKDAQELAITQAQGGKRDQAIPWSEPQSGVQGTIIWDPSVTLTLSCRRYHQTILFGFETLAGPLTACPGDEGRWKLSAIPGQ